MTKYTIENTSEIRKPCRVFDADGVELKYVVMCDTETGEVEQLVYNENDRHFEKAIGNTIARSVKFYPKPLRIEFI